MDRALRNRILTFLALAVVVATVLIRMIGRQPVAKISAVTPAHENVISSISSNGKVEPIAPYVMRAQLDTFVERLYVAEGQEVKKGQLLMELDVKDAQARLAETRSKLLRAEDDLKTAQAGGRADEAARTASALETAIAQRDRLQRNHEALERLMAQHAATKDELAANDLELGKAQAHVKELTAAKEEFERGVKLNAGQFALVVQELRSQVTAQEEKVKDGRILAPADGTLYALGRHGDGNLPLKAGDYVKVGDLLAEMADLHRVRVRAFIDEPELGGLEPGEPVKISWDALPGRVWTGKTEIIPKQVVPRGNRSVGELVCNIDNPKLELLPNINVNVRINSKERFNVLTVPRGAVETNGGHRYVFVVKRNDFGVGKSRLARREIQVGVADTVNYEVTGGLQEDELVALPGDVDLKDGMLVRVVNTDADYIRGRQNVQ